MITEYCPVNLTQISVRIFTNLLYLRLLVWSCYFCPVLNVINLLYILVLRASAYDLVYCINNLGISANVPAVTSRGVQNAPI